MAAGGWPTWYIEGVDGRATLSRSSCVDVTGVVNRQILDQALDHVAELAVRR
jgi:hypothetical protein